MARTANHISTIQITISTTPPVKRLLEKLVATGLYGKNAAEAAERIVARGLEHLIKDGALH
jgi:hypothetical protein